MFCIWNVLTKQNNAVSSSLHGATNSIGSPRALPCFKQIPRRIVETKIKTSRWEEIEVQFVSVLGGWPVWVYVKYFDCGLSLLKFFQTSSRCAQTASGPCCSAGEMLANDQWQSAVYTTPVWSKTCCWLAPKHQKQEFQQRRLLHVTSVTTQAVTDVTCDGGDLFTLFANFLHYRSQAWHVETENYNHVHHACYLDTVASSTYSCWQKY